LEHQGEQRDEGNDGKISWESAVMKRMMESFFGNIENTPPFLAETCCGSQGEGIDQGNDGRISYEYGELKKERPEHLKRELSRWVFQQAQAHTPSLLFVQM
jgi:hypothetical protein